MLLSPRSVVEVKQQRPLDSKTLSPTRESGSPKRKRVAIIGSGCSGLGAAWALGDSDYEVHIFEKSARLGGHTNTQIWHHGKEATPVDTGFIVMNTATYPNFIRFLKHIGVQTRETEMSFGVTRDAGVFEWSGETRGLFAQRRNFFRFRHWRMLFDIVRFNQFALDLLSFDKEANSYQDKASLTNKNNPSNLSIGEYLDREGYSDAFRDDYLIPMTAAVWSTSPDKASLDFPAETLVRFMWNHHLLSTLATRPAWLTIPGGSQQYIDAIVQNFRPNRLHLHLSCTITGVLRPSKTSDHNVRVSWTTGENGQAKNDTFDHVIFACHGDQILPILDKLDDSSDRASITGMSLNSVKANHKRNDSSSQRSSASVPQISDDEQDILSAFKTSQNICYLHSDLSLMPSRRRCWTSWNYLVESHPSKLSHPAGVSLTYCMNILQHLPEQIFGPVLVTMNPGHKPDPKLIQGEYVYEHPLYTTESVRAQRRLQEIQNKRGVSYCGAWTKYGFHEDGFSSGLRVAIDHLGATLPFEFVDSTYSRGHLPQLDWRDRLCRLVVLSLLFSINILVKLLGLPLVATCVALLSSIASFLLDVAEGLGLLDLV